MKPDVARLQSLPLFASLSPAECGQIADWLEEREVSAGARLGSEGAAGYTFFVIEEGTAAVIRNGRQLAELGPGDFFGEIAILGTGRRTATVVAVSPMKLLVVFGTEFRRMEARMPEVAARIREAMSERLESSRLP